MGFLDNNLEAFDVTFYVKDGPNHQKSVRTVIYARNSLEIVKTIKQQYPNFKSLKFSKALPKVRDKPQPSDIADEPSNSREDHESEEDDDDSYEAMREEVRIHNERVRNGVTEVREVREVREVSVFRVILILAVPIFLLGWPICHFMSYDDEILISKGQVATYRDFFSGNAQRDTTMVLASDWDDPYEFRVTLKAKSNGEDVKIKIKTDKFPIKVVNVEIPGYRGKSKLFGVDTGHIKGCASSSTAFILTEADGVLLSDQKKLSLFRQRAIQNYARSKKLDLNKYEIDY